MLLFLLVDNGRKGVESLFNLQKKIGKITCYEFNDLTKILVTTLVNFNMVDALVCKMIESLNGVASVFVEKREDCCCFLFGEGKVCVECKNGVYGKARKSMD